MTQPEKKPGHRERLRNRFLTGAAGLSEAQLLELLLTYAIPRRDVRPVAHALLERFGTLNRVLGASLRELTAVAGIGDHAATLIKLIAHLTTGSDTGAEEESEMDIQPPLFQVESEPERAEPVLKTFVDDEVADSLTFLPEAEHFPSLDAFRAHLNERLPYNSSSTRKRRAHYIVTRFFPAGRLHTPLTFYAARCTSKADLKPAVFYHILKAEILAQRVAEELILPALPVGRVSRDDLREFVLRCLPDIGTASQTKVLRAFFKTYDLLSVGQEDGDTIRFRIHPGTREGFLYILTAEFSESGMYSFEQLEEGTMRRWLLWDKEWMHLQLYNLRDLGILSKVSQIDTVRQFTLQFDQRTALRHYFDHPERGQLALRDRAVAYDRV